MKKKEKEKLVCIYKSETKSMDPAPPLPHPLSAGEVGGGVKSPTKFSKWGKGLDRA